MGIETAIMGAAVIGGGASILGGIKANNASKDQANIIRQQATEDANEELFQGTRFRETQRVEFAKSGVKLAGSPLLVLQETTDRTKKNADNILRSGYNQASEVRKSGRQALFSGVAGAASAGMKAGGLLM